eukprot:321471_1
MNKKILIILSTIYSLSFGRRLLQTGNAQGQGQGQVQIPVTIPEIPANAGPPANIMCNIPCSNAVCASDCAGKIFATVNNPGNGFEIGCLASGSCAGSQININYSAGGMTRFLPLIKISGQYAIYGATITINSQQTGVGLKVTEIDCGKGNCAGGHFVFIGADFGDIKCEEYGGCGTDCFVTQHGVKVSCDSVSTT